MQDCLDTVKGVLYALRCRRERSPAGRNTVKISQEQREKIEALVAEFFESSADLQSVSQSIEDVIVRKLERKAAKQAVRA